MKGEVWMKYRKIDTIDLHRTLRKLESNPKVNFESIQVVIPLPNGFENIEFDGDKWVKKTLLKHPKKVKEQVALKTASSPDLYSLF